MLGVDCCSCMCPSIEFWSMNTLTYTHYFDNDHWTFRYTLSNCGGVSRWLLIFFFSVIADLDLAHCADCSDATSIFSRQWLSQFYFISQWHTGHRCIKCNSVISLSSSHFAPLLYLVNSNLCCKTNTTFANFNFKQEKCSKWNVKLWGNLFAWTYSIHSINE